VPVLASGTGFFEASDATSACLYECHAPLLVDPGWEHLRQGRCLELPRPDPGESDIRDLIVFFDGRVGIVIDGVGLARPTMPCPLPMAWPKPMPSSVTADRSRLRTVARPDNEAATSAGDSVRLLTSGQGSS
jgi:hypothetical protein